MPETISVYLSAGLPTAELLEEVVQLCRKAGQSIMDVYQQPALAVDYKVDHSPVTAADLAAHNVLVPGLLALLPDVPVVSEEAEVPGYGERRQWELYWLVDPLDGTKEFISGNGEFTVNVALIREGKPVAGVVYAPVLDTCYTGLEGLGAFKYKGTDKRPIHTRGIGSREQAGLPVEVVASRRHGMEATNCLISLLGQRFHSLDKKNVGSSLKLCLIAEGEADYYPRLSPTCEWDTAAAQAVVEAAGGAVFDGSFRRLLYNQKTDLLNPCFHVVGDSSFPWADLLTQVPG